MNEINAKNSNKKVYKYYLSIEGAGCELVMGAVSDRFSNYWINRSKSDLRRYMFADEDERPEIANDIDVSGPWHEMDDLAHANGPFTNGAHIKVIDYNGENILKLRGLNELEECTNVTTKIDFRSKNVRKETGVIKLANHSDHDLGFLIKTNKPFDPRLLKIEQDLIDGLAILDTVYYDERVLRWKEWGTTGYSGSVLLLPRKVA